MKKRRNQTLNDTIFNKRIKRFVKLLKEDKKFFALFGVLMSLVLVIGSTFAWSSYSSWVDNHMQTEIGTLDVRVSEKFEQDSVLFPNTIIEKEVKVRNNSEKLAVIRVKLVESSSLLQLNSQTGALKTKKKEATDQEINREVVSTWNVGSIYKAPDSNDDFYVLKDVVKEEAYDYSRSTPRNKHFEKINLGFSSGTGVATTPGATNPYWVYDNGYFYYSRVLKGNETTEVSLLENISVLANGQKNSMKNQLYNLDVNAYGVIANEESIDDWNVSNSIKEMFKEDNMFGKK